MYNKMLYVTATLSFLGKNELITLRNTLVTQLQYVKGNRRNEIHIHQVTLLNYMSSVYIDVQKRVNEIWSKLSVNGKRAAAAHMNFIISKLNRRCGKISKEEMKNFDNELSRLHRVFDLVLLESNEHFIDLKSCSTDIQEKVRNNHILLKLEIYTLGMFTQKLNANIEKQLKDISRLLNTVITDEERRMVHNVMIASIGRYNTSNRWYKCRGCNDVYFVADCGAVNQTTRCRKCNTTIGDHSRIADQNMIQIAQRRF